MEIRTERVDLGNMNTSLEDAFSRLDADDLTLLHAICHGPYAVRQSLPLARYLQDCVEAECNKRKFISVAWPQLPLNNMGPGELTRAQFFSITLTESDVTAATERVFKLLNHAVYGAVAGRLLDYEVVMEELNSLGAAK